VRRLKSQPGRGLFTGGVKLPLALAELGLIDEYEFVVQPRLAGHGPTLFAGLSKHVDLKLVSRLEFGSGAVAMRYERRRSFEPVAAFCFRPTAACRDWQLSSSPRASPAAPTTTTVIVAMVIVTLDVPLVPLFRACLGNRG